MHPYPRDATPFRISRIIHKHMGIAKHVSSKVCRNISHGMHAFLAVATENGRVLIHHGLAGAIHTIAAHVVIHDRSLAACVASIIVRRRSRIDAAGCIEISQRISQRPMRQTQLSRSPRDWAAELAENSQAA